MEIRHGPASLEFAHRPSCTLATGERDHSVRFRHDRIARQRAADIPPRTAVDHGVLGVEEDEGLCAVAEEPVGADVFVDAEDLTDWIRKGNRSGPRSRNSVWQRMLLRGHTAPSE